MQRINVMSSRRYIWTLIYINFWRQMNEMAAIWPEVEEMTIKLRKFAKYFLKVYPFARAPKIQGLAVTLDPSRYGNTYFTKITYIYD